MIKRIEDVQISDFDRVGSDEESDIPWQELPDSVNVRYGIGTDGVVHYEKIDLHAFASMKVSDRREGK